MSNLTETPRTGSETFREDGDIDLSVVKGSQKASSNLLTDLELLVVSEDMDSRLDHATIEEISKAKPSIPSPETQEHLVLHP